MPSNTLHDSPRHGRARIGLALGAAAALLISVALYLHGVGWWYAPVGIVALHVIPIVVMLAVSAVLVGRRAPDGSAVIRAPRLYDALVGLLTLGRERRMRRRTLELAGLQPGERVLDVGCGTGTLLCEAAPLVAPDGELHGVEPGDAMRARAAAKGARHGAALQLQGAPATALPFPDGRFDVVFCTMVLHHLPRSAQPAALAEMRRVTRPGGRIVVAELQRPPTRAGRWRSFLSAIGRLHGTPAGDGDWGVLDLRSEWPRLGCTLETAEQRGAMATVVARVPEEA